MSFVQPTTLILCTTFRNVSPDGVPHRVMRRIQDRRSAAPHASTRRAQPAPRRTPALPVASSSPRRPPPQSRSERRRLPSPVENQHHRHRTAPERCRDKELTTPHRRNAWGKWWQRCARRGVRTCQPSCSAKPPSFIVFQQMLLIRARLIIFSHCSSSAQPQQS